MSATHVGGGQPNQIDLHVGHRVRLRRTALRFSRERLAAVIGLTHQQVQKYELGGHRISASGLMQIAQALRAPISYFFEDFEAAPFAANDDAYDDVANDPGPQEGAE